jgi:hypothetical protein
MFKYIIAFKLNKEAGEREWIGRWIVYLDNKD